MISSQTLFRTLLCAALMLRALCGGVVLGAEGRVLTRVAEIRALSRQEAEKALPVRIRGVVTWQNTSPNIAFVINDGVQGIYVECLVARERGVWKAGTLAQSATEPGALVEIEGVSDPGGYAPVILPAQVRRVGSGPLPAPRCLPVERLLSGNEDSQRVEVEGVVQAVTDLDRVGNSTVTVSMMVDGHHCRVRFERGRELIAASLVDAKVRVRGVLAPMFNVRAEVTGLKIHCMGADDIEVLLPPPGDPFLAPQVALDRLLPFSPDREPFHRQVTRGVVTFARRGEFFFLQGGDTGVRVQSARASVQVGEQVEVAGFVETTHTLASLGNAAVRSLGHGTVPAPLAVTVKQMLHPQYRYIARLAATNDHSGRLVRLRGKLIRVERDEMNRPRTLLIESGGQTFSAMLPGPDRERPGSPALWAEGAEMALTGVCELDFAEGAISENQVIITGFHLWLRSPQDVQVLRSPSWWTAARLQLALLWTGVIIVLGVAWIVLLRRLLRRRTQRLEQVMRSHRNVELEYASAQRERLRLAVDLHDGIKQRLAAASFRVDAAAGHLPGSPVAAAAQIETAHNTLLRTQTELDECLWGLHAVAEGPPDFVPLLRHVIASAEHWPKGAVMIESEGTPRRLARDVAGSLLLLFQEATGNAFRHGHATHITASVSYGADALDLRIVDDGTGFDPRTVPGPRAGHFGIDGMKQRMHWLRGTLHITRHAGGGMEIHARLPWSGMEETDVSEREPSGKDRSGDSKETP